MLALAPRKFWAQPGELRLLLAHYAIEPAPESPLLVNADLLSAESETSVHELLRAALFDIDANALRAHLEGLARPAACVRALRGARPLEPALAFACAGTHDWENATVICPEEDGSAVLLMLPDRPALVDWLMEGLRVIALPEITLTGLPPLAPSGIAIVFALADIFRERYPDPDLEWLPDQPIVVAVDELLEALSAHDSHSLAVAYERLGEPKLPSLELDQLQMLLYVLANEQLVELDPNEPPITSFQISEQLTWLIRCLAWWDLTLRVDSWPGTEGLSNRALIVIQASSLWRCAHASDGPTGAVELRAIDSAELERRLQDVLEPSGGVTEVSCISCGGPIRADAGFCPTCGASKEHSAMLAPPAVRHCTGCGQPLNPTARFCGSCGQPVGE